MKGARLEGRGKMAAAAAELGSLPQGPHVGPQTISNASRAMEQLLFRHGGLETIGRFSNHSLRGPLCVWPC